MTDNKIKFYDIGEKKTTITFNNFIRKKLYKIIIRNSIFISIIFVIMFFSVFLYQAKNLNKMVANIYNVNQANEEHMNNYSNYLKIQKINYRKKYEMLINKANPVSEDIASLYKQVYVTDNIYNGIKLEENTYKNYLKLKKAIEDKGYFLNIKSGFRSFEESQNIYDSYANEKGEEYARNYVAAPGSSEHNTGLAIDIIISTEENTLKTNYQSDEYKYLENIAYLYGFIIRYPKDKEKITGYSYEPWHLRYVGKELAKYLTKNNLTLEEYYETGE